MAAKSLLLVPVTLCLLLVLPAQAREANVAAIFYGKAQCKNNPSMIITNATLGLMINKAMVPGATGRTTETGRIEMKVILNSTEHVAALMSNGNNNVMITAPPHACGAPKLAAVKMVAAPVNVTAVIRAGTRSVQDTPVSVQPIAASDGVLGLLGAFLEQVGDFICVA
ncbi:hypothetical protein ACP70R_004958 [Stipagrostis hirtigluma subsp. patula]